MWGLHLSVMLCSLEMPKDELPNHNCIKHLRSVVQQQQTRIAELEKTSAEHKHQLAEQVGPSGPGAAPRRDPSARVPLGRVRLSPVGSSHHRQFVHSVPELRASSYGEGAELRGRGVFNSLTCWGLRS